MANRGGHRRFGNIRKLPSGRHQIRYPGPDGRIRTGSRTYATKGEASQALTLIEAQMISGEWTDPEKGKIKLSTYGETWIQQRPGLRPRTVDLYTWLLRKHITPYLGGVAIGKLTTATVREWRATLLGKGVSVSVVAKAYRLLRAVLMTAVEEDKILNRNPCRIKGAGDEHAAERPVLTISQVFEVADRVGRRPIGNIRKITKGKGCRLRFQRHGEMRTHPEVFATRKGAEEALWRMADQDRVDCRHDRRFRALVLLAAFCSLRWGEVTALRRSDVDLDSGTVHVTVAFIERSTGEMILGPPKSRAGVRIVGIPQAIIPALREHLSVFVEPKSGALLFTGVKGGPLRRSGLNKLTGWPYVVAAIGAQGLHFHDLRHTGNQFAADTGAGLKDLMSRMGQDSERAAMIYLHRAKGADQKITSGINDRVEAERGTEDRDNEDGDEGTGGVLAPVG